MEQENNNALIASTNFRLTDFSQCSNQKNTDKLYIKNEKSPILLKQLPSNQDSIKKQLSSNKADHIRRRTKTSYTLGIITLISTILFVFYFITIPTALICCILAIKNGRIAINLMGNDVELNNQYRAKARNGLRLGMSFIYFLIIVSLLGLLAGIYFGSIILGLILAFNFHVEYGLLLGLALGLVIAFLFIWLYYQIIQKIRNTIPSLKIHSS